MLNFESENTYLTFDDVLLVPQYSEVRSRKEVSLKSGLLDLDIPIISANMDTISEHEMLIELYRLGAMGILHRFMDNDRLLSELRILERHIPKNRIAVSVGVKSDDKEKIPFLLKHAGVICVDIAHGHNMAALEMVRHIRSLDKNVIIIAGNVATKKGVYSLQSAGASIVKCGVGPGSHCTTRQVTGHGVPQLSAIADCVEAAEACGIEIIADGGIKIIADGAKALAAGARYIMLGSMLSATDETPGEILEANGKKYKNYRGQASFEAMKATGKDLNITPEGVSKLKLCKGPVADIITKFAGGLKSALSYSGAHDLVQFRKQAKFIRVSSNTLIENTPHGLNGE